MIKKQQTKSNTKEFNNKRVRIHKERFIAETETAVLFNIEKGNIWINKKGIYSSEYSNYLSIYLPELWEYTILDDNNNVIEKVSCKKLVELFEQLG